MKTQDSKYDVVIVGAGPAGLSFALCAAGKGLKIAVIDPAPKAVLQKPSYDGREIALTHFSYNKLVELGAIKAMPKDAVSLIKKAHVINGTSPYALKFNYQDAGEETLGYMTANQNIKRALFAVADKAKEISWFLEEKVADVKADQIGAKVILQSGKQLTAKLIVAADGRFSKTRQAMSIPVQMKNLGRSCIVGKMKHDGPHHDTAYECFHYDRTLAVLPLNNGEVSVVITLPSDQEQSVLSMDPEDLAQDLAERFEHRVGKMRAAGKLQSYPLVCTYAQSFIATRYALLGDAAVGMHPVTAHGFNLGLRGAVTLSEEILAMHETGLDIGSNIALGNYNRRHQLECKPLYLGTNALVKLYTNTSRPAKVARKALLHLGNLLKPANRLITRQLTQSK